MSDSWKSCDNCGDEKECWFDRDDLPFDGSCHAWTPMRCPRCGGALSITLYHRKLDADENDKGRPYRHCYSCHAEFYEGVTT